MEINTESRLNLDGGKAAVEELFKKEIEDFLQVAPSIADKIFKERVPHVDNFLFFLCACVEMISQENKGKVIRTNYKRHLAMLLIPTALNFLLTSGKISLYRKEILEQKFNDPLETTLKIQNLIDVSNNSILLNNKKKESRFSCCPCF